MARPVMIAVVDLAVVVHCLAPVYPVGSYAENC